MDSLIAQGKDPRENLTFDPTDEFTRVSIQISITNAPINTGVYIAEESYIFYCDRLPKIYETDNNFKQGIYHNYDDLFGADKLNLLQDPMTNEIYWVWLESGIISISHINQENWQLGELKHIPGLPYPDKIFIANNRCYFIHRMALNNGFSNFYSFDLPFGH